MTTTSAPGSTNWWGLASTIGLFVWFLFWFADEPHSIIGQVLLWGPLALIHWFAFQAARRRFGWIYVAPLGIFWILVVIGLCGGIPTS
jgi:hypothetical protein